MKTVKDYIRTIPDFPKEGIMFRDITTVIQDADGLALAIEKRELIKVTVLENSGYEVKDAGNEIAAALNAEFVCATGRKLVFYKRSYRKDVEHIEF